MPFPSPPWSLHGTAWLSLFAVRSGTPERPAGLYGAAFVGYTEPGVLSYQELAVGRLIRDGRLPRMTLTDVWVDSVASRDGGRSLWSVPKEIAELHLVEQTMGPAMRTSCDANIAGAPLAAARFTGARLGLLRTPFRITVSQEREDGATVLAPVTASWRGVPVHARWDFGADGPLAWLHGRSPVSSFRLGDIKMTFGD